MAKGLSVSRVVRVTITLSPKATQYRNFGAMMLVGPSEVIDVVERRREYNGLDGIAQDFGTNTPEYLAADLFFSQLPQPDLLYVGRWAQTDSRGMLHGGMLSPTEQLLTNFTSITDGSLHVAIDGTAHDITGINLSGALNLNNVASLIQTAIAAQFSGATVTWDAVQNRFNILSGTVGIASSVGYTTAAATGTDLGAKMKTVSGQASTPVVGIAAETLPTAIASLADTFPDWYGVTVVSNTGISQADLVAVSQYIEGSDLSRIHAVTTQQADVLDPTTDADIGSSLQTLNLNKTFSQYSTDSPYAAISILGRISTINFEADDTMLTVKFKQEPGVAAEYLSATQASTLQAKNVNVFAHYINGANIIQEGVMASGMYIDERHGMDWLQNALQTDCFNALYGAVTKIPQTDAGEDVLVAVCKGTMQRAVRNGMVAPGRWTGPAIGQLKTGDVLPTGYYVHAGLMADQSDADRAARKATPIQIAAKLAGAIHSVDVLVTLNR